MTNQPYAQPLSQHLILRSHDADEIQTLLASVYNDSKFRVTPTGRERVISHELYAVRLGRIGLTSISFVGDVEVVAPELVETYDFCSAHRDSAEFRVGSDSVNYGQTSGVVLSPNRPLRVRTERITSLNFAVPRSAMQTHLQALTGHELAEPLEFASAIDFRNKKLASLWRMVLLLAEEIEYDESILTDPLVAERYVKR